MQGMSAIADTISDMAKHQSEPESEDKKPENRSPAWAVYARLDPELEDAFADYQADFEYPPKLARVIENALKRLFREHGHYPRKKKRT